MNAKPPIEPPDFTAIELERGTSSGERLRSPLHAHPHSHSHAEGHSHSHSHEHPPGGAAHAFTAPRGSHNRELARGAAEGLTLLLDTPSGIAGDMTIAALLDLGVPFAMLESALAGLRLDGYHVRAEAARSGAIGGSRFSVDITGPQPERSYAQIVELLERSSLEPSVRALALRIFSRLADAESEVHRVPVESVHFHEVGAIDAIVDIVGAAACLCYLGAARVLATPLPLGRGFVRCQHGLLPLPAPATVLCLKGVPTYDPGVEGEWVTPTGAAIVASVADEFCGWPRFAPERVGWGCGTRSLGERPNALRAVLGRPFEPNTQRSDTHVLLEANVDDMTGELAAHAIQTLLGAGALDAWAQPVTMKKGRPGLVLSALAESARADGVAEVMLRETSSIGLRRLSVSRDERPRRMLEVETRFGKLPLKVSEGGFGPALAKPEFDACALVAARHNVPVREVLAAALAAYEGQRR